MILMNDTFRLWKVAKQQVHLASKEISNKPVHEALLQEQQIQRKTSFLFCTI
jgi:hypothetical protein